MIKRTLAIILAVVMIFTLAACGKKDEVGQAYREAALTYMEDAKGIIIDIKNCCYDLENEMSAAINSTDGSYDTNSEALYTQLVNDLNELSAIKEKINSLETSEGVAELSKRISKFFKDMERTTADSIDVVEFYNEFFEIENKYTTAQNNDFDQYLNDRYAEFKQEIEEFKAMKKPACIADLFEHYIHMDEILCTAIVSLYKGNHGDYLKKYSVNSMLKEFQPINHNYVMNLYKYMRLAFASAEDMIEELGYDAVDEIIEACKSEKPEEYVFSEFVPSTSLSYDIVDEIYPVNYNSLDCVVRLFAQTNGDALDVTVRCEVDGFTQVFEKKMTIDKTLQILEFKPPILSEQPSLSNGKTTQVTFSIKDNKTGEYIVQESKNIDLHSIYDFTLKSNNFGTTLYENLLAFMQPESEAILTLRREAITWLGKALGEENAILPGYQGSYGFSAGDIRIVKNQAVALQAAMSDLGVRYNMGAYTLNDEAIQRILLPEDVINNRSGICIETSLVIASALQSAGLNPMLILTPGHCQVAVEKWRGSGEYFLLETTMLPYEGKGGYVTDLTNDEWQKYLETKAQYGNVYVIDCSVAPSLGIIGIR